MSLSCLPRNDLENYVNCFTPKASYSEMIFHYIYIYIFTFYLLHLHSVTIQMKPEKNIRLL